MKKDYSLLRPFDLEAAKRGEPICFKDDGQLATFLGESDQVKNDICLRWEETIASVIAGKCAMLDRMLISMAPLCWVEGKPVYKGDVLYWKDSNTCWKVIATVEGLKFDDGSVRTYDSHISDDYFTWTPPKVKREAWVNVYAYGKPCWRYPTKEKADNSARLRSGLIDPDRIACVRIEWEE